MIELSEEVKIKFEGFAKEEWPRESCGLVAVVKGKQQYFHCRNIAPGKEDFILDPLDYIRVHDFVESHAGQIVAVIHSHPSTAAIPSMADKVGCEQSGLRWFIFSHKTGEWSLFDPSGYQAPLVGRPFKHGIFDCYSALRDWYKLKRGIEIPDYDRDQEWWRKGQNLLMDNFRSAGFEQTNESHLQEGDVLLINICSSVVNHCAVYVGDDQVFHQTMNRLSSREVYGGWLKKNTRMALRYKK